MHRHIEVLPKPGQRRGRDLHIEIPIPGHDLAIPPPAQQRAVRDPGLDVPLAEVDEIAPDQMVEGIRAFVIGDRVPFVVSYVVVA